MDQRARTRRRLPQVRDGGQEQVGAPGTASGEELLTVTGSVADPDPAGVQAIERRVRVTNRQGIHARPAHLFVRTANEFRSEILVIREGAHEVNGKSMMGMLTLAAAHGTELIIRASGPDADEAVTALEGLFLAGFGEE